MDLNRYKIFLSVADSGSFTAAAAAWNYTPSGVVHLINALEQEFGFPLFVRTRRGVHLTTDGEQLVAPLRDLVQCDDRLRQVCSKIQGVLTGKVRIGSYYSTGCRRSSAGSTGISPACRSSSWRATTSCSTS